MLHEDYRQKRSDKIKLTILLIVVFVLGILTIYSQKSRADVIIRPGTSQEVIYEGHSGKQG